MKRFTISIGLTALLFVFSTSAIADDSTGNFYLDLSAVSDYQNWIFGRSMTHSAKNCDAHSIDGNFSQSSSKRASWCNVSVGGFIAQGEMTWTSTVQLLRSDGALCNLEVVADCVIPNPNGDSESGCYQPKSVSLEADPYSKVTPCPLQVIGTTGDGFGHDFSVQFGEVSS